MPSPTTIRDICTDALMELGVLSQGETMDAGTGDFMRRKLERLLNLWNARRVAVYADVFSSFTMTPGLSPHTIGPTAATFTVTQRPVTIEGIALVLNTSSPSVNVEMTQHDAAWWQAQSVPGLQTDIPTDFYYDPTWTAAAPNGSIYFWPVPDVAYPIQIRIRNLLTDTLTLNTTFSLPPGYQEAVTLTLAEMSARSFGKQMPPDLTMQATQARAFVFANNAVTPSLSTLDAGMQGPSLGGPRASFNWLTGSDTV